MTTMPFGKHVGEKLDEIPLDYLRWVLRECKSIPFGLRRAIRDVIAANERDANQEPAASPGVPVVWSEVISVWYRQMARKYHPDRGGSHEAMLAVADGYERLKELTGDRT